jgi:hypothetical protein
VNQEKIIQIMFAPNNSTWQGVLLGLSSTGETYYEENGRWEKFIQNVGYKGDDKNDQ